MATCNVQPRFRLTTHARVLLYVATMLARIGLPLPRGWVAAVTNRSWMRRLHNGTWRRIQIDTGGRIIQ